MDRRYSSATAAIVLVLVLLATSVCVPSVRGSATVPSSPSAQPPAGLQALTTADVESLKQVMGVRDPNQDYNVIIDGHGTGLAPPSEDDYATMAEGMQVAVPSASAPAAPSSYDLSTDPCFPKVGNQGSQGSCAAWAMTYYCYGYIEAKDNGWTEASKGNASQLLSPAWTYNKVDGGADHGSWMSGIGEVLTTWGGATMSTMPYVQSDPTSWGTEAAFREAPLHRAQSVVTIPYDATNYNTMLSQIKSAVTSGSPVTFAMNANSFNNIGSDHILYYSGYQVGSLNHAQTIVGYDDSLVTDNGITGAFRVVNSWGTGFQDHGYYWMTYAAFTRIGSGNQLVYVQDRPHYQPSLLGVWHYSVPQGQDGSITVTTVGGSATVSPSYAYSSMPLPNFLCLDLSDLRSDYDAGRTTFALTVSSSTAGTCTSFRTELYGSGYAVGSPTQVSDASPSTPTGTITNLRSTLQNYSARSLSNALDLPSGSFTSRGNAQWTAENLVSTRGGYSVQSGDVSNGARSYLNLSLDGEGTVQFDWRMNCSGSDSLELRANGVSQMVLTGATSWTHASVALSTAHTDLSWTFYRQGTGGGCGWVDNVTWFRKNLHIDSEQELRDTAGFLNWPGAGTALDPYLLDALSVTDPSAPELVYIGNTTSYFTITGSELTGGTLPGQTALELFNVTNAAIDGCTVVGNTQGIALENCTSVTLTSNVIASSYLVGVQVRNSSLVTLVGNNISLNGVGVDISASSGSVYDNMFYANTGPAVRVASTVGCTFDRNAFLLNNGSGPVYSAAHAQASDASGSSWCRDVGNYWSDWTTGDADGDGIVDLPYELGSASDPLPMAAPVLPVWGLAGTRSDTTVSLAWNAPNASAYAPVLGYEVSRAGSDGTVTFSSLTTNYLDASSKAPGTYHYRVRAYSALGPGPWVTVDVIIPDLVPPTVSITSPAAGAWYKTATVTVSWSAADAGSGVAYCELSVDGGAVQNMSLATSANVGPLLTGQHTVTVRAVDAAGNSGTDTRTFNVDLIAPSIVISSPAPNAVLGGSEVSFVLSVTDPGSGQHRDIVRVDGQLMRSSSDVSTIAFSMQLADGVHRLSVTSTDRAGNGATASIQFTVDSTNPTLTITAPTDGSFVPTADVTVQWTASHPAGVAKVELSIDGGPWTDQTGKDEVTLPGLSEGVHVLSLRAYDPYGHTVVVWTNFTVDSSVPTAVLSSDGYLPVDRPIVVRFSEPMNASSLDWTPDGFAATAAWSGLDLIITPDRPLDYDREYAIALDVRDLGGHGTGPLTLTFHTSNLGAVDGTIVDGSGRPIEGATVRGEDGTSAVTGQNGSFRMNLTGGAHTLTVHKDGYSDLTCPVTLEPGQTASIGRHELSSSSVPSSDQTLTILIAALVACAALGALFVFARRKK